MAGNDGDNKDDKLLYCSFCGKSQDEVRKLIAGPTVYICDECIDLCNDIIAEESSGVNTTDIARRAFSVCYMDAVTQSSRRKMFPRVFGEGAMAPEVVI